MVFIGLFQVSKKHFRNQKVVSELYWIVIHQHFIFEETKLALIRNPCPVAPLVAFLTTKSALKGIISTTTGRSILLNCFRKKKDSKLLNGVLIVAWAQGPRVTCIILFVLFSGADGVRTSRKRRGPGAASLQVRGHGLFTVALHYSGWDNWPSHASICSVSFSRYYCASSIYNVVCTTTTSQKSALTSSIGVDRSSTSLHILNRRIYIYRRFALKQTIDIDEWRRVLVNNLPRPMHEHAWSFSCLRNAHGGSGIQIQYFSLNSRRSIESICCDACLPCSAHQTKLRPSGQSASRCRLRRAAGGQSDRCLGFSYVYFYLYILYITFDSSSYTCRAHIPNRERWFLCNFLVWSNLCSFL